MAIIVVWMRPGSPPDPDIIASVQRMHTEAFPTVFDSLAAAERFVNLRPWPAHLDLWVYDEPAQVLHSESHLRRIWSGVRPARGRS